MPNYIVIESYRRYGDMMTVYLGARQTVYLNTYDVIKEAFVKKGNLFSGRPQDVFWVTELCDSIGTVELLIF